jgi:hydrogenase maturation protease
MGNPILRDDRVGLRVIEELEGLLNDPQVALARTTQAGLNLLEFFDGVDQAFIIDAIQTGDKPGKISWLTPGDLVARQSRFWIHNLDLIQTLSIGEGLGRSMPKDIHIVAVEAEDTSSFNEALSSEVERAVPMVVEQILAELEKNKGGL